ncbi:PH domain-containing protein [Chloroflexi bacterium TSY]|nr:PH domain-containing protein [Chloroflexi bacterium TSY]
MVFKAISSPSRWEGIAISLWVILIDILLLIWILRRPVDWIKFGLIVLLLASLPFLAHFVYRTWSVLTLEYWVDRNAITIAWAGMRQVIPLYRVQRIIQDSDQEAKGGWHHWPAIHLRPVQTADLGDVQMFATRPMKECILLDLDDVIYAVSPAAPEAFIDAVQERYRLGQAVFVKAGRVHSSLFQRIWGRLIQKDLIGTMLILVGILGVLVLFGLLMVRFPDLPTDLVFRYNADGLPERISSKSALFLLPIIGLMAWVVNFIWGVWMAARDQKIGAYMLWGGTVVVHIFSLMALWRLMS